MPETARYLYAVSRGLDPAVVDGVSGLGGPVEVLEHRGLTVLVSTVGLDEYGEEALRRNLESLPWLERTARTHDRVVRVAAERAPTAPMRLVTICHDDRAVRERLDESFDRLTAALDRVTGRQEWSVKVFAPPRQAEPVATAPGAAPGGGAAYLRARKAAVEARRTGEEAALVAAESLHAELATRAAAARRLAPQDPRLSGYREPMVLNAAYLVEEADAARFPEAVAAVASAQPTVRVEVGGPWPPYSFATLEDV